MADSTTSRSTIPGWVTPDMVGQANAAADPIPSAPALPVPAYPHGASQAAGTYSDRGSVPISAPGYQPQSPALGTLSRTEVAASIAKTAAKPSIQTMSVAAPKPETGAAFPTGLDIGGILKHAPASILSAGLKGAANTAEFSAPMFAKAEASLSSSFDNWVTDNGLRGTVLDNLMNGRVVLDTRGPVSDWSVSLASGSDMRGSPAAAGGSMIKDALNGLSNQGNKIANKVWQPMYPDLAGAIKRKDWSYIAGFALENAPQAVGQAVMARADAPLYMLALTSGFALSRAKADGRTADSINTTDVLTGIGAAAVTQVLDIVGVPGANKLFGKAAARTITRSLDKHFVTRVAKGAVRTAAAEGTEEVLQGGFTNIGTKQGYSLNDAFVNFVGGAVVGAPIGGTVGGFRGGPKADTGVAAPAPLGPEAQLPAPKPPLPSGQPAIAGPAAPLAITGPDGSQKAITHSVHIPPAPLGSTTPRVRPGRGRPDVVMAPDGTYPAPKTVLTKAPLPGSGVKESFSTWSPDTKTSKSPGTALGKLLAVFYGGSEKVTGAGPADVRAAFAGYFASVAQAARSFGVALKPDARARIEAAAQQLDHTGSEFTAVASSTVPGARVDIPAFLDVLSSINPDLRDAAMASDPAVLLGLLHKYTAQANKALAPLGADPGYVGNTGATTQSASTTADSISRVALAGQTAPITPSEAVPYNGVGAPPVGVRKARRAVEASQTAASNKHTYGKITDYNTAVEPVPTKRRGLTPAARAKAIARDLARRADARNAAAISPMTARRAKSQQATKRKLYSTAIGGAAKKTSGGKPAVSTPVKPKPTTARAKKAIAAVGTFSKSELSAVTDAAHGVVSAMRSYRPKKLVWVADKTSSSGARALPGYQAAIDISKGLKKVQRFSPVLNKLGRRVYKPTQVERVPIPPADAVTYEGPGIVKAPRGDFPATMDAIDPALFDRTVEHAAALGVSDPIEVARVIIDQVRKSRIKASGPSGKHLPGPRASRSGATPGKPIVPGTPVDPTLPSTVQEPPAQPSDPGVAEDPQSVSLSDEEIAALAALVQGMEDGNTIGQDSTAAEITAAADSWVKQLQTDINDKTLMVARAKASIGRASEHIQNTPLSEPTKADAADVVSRKRVSIPVDIWPLAPRTMVAKLRADGTVQTLQSPSRNPKSPWSKPKTGESTDVTANSALIAELHHTIDYVESVTLPGLQARLDSYRKALSIAGKAAADRRTSTQKRRSVSDAVDATAVQDGYIAVAKASPMPDRPVHDRMAAAAAADPGIDTPYLDALVRDHQLMPHQRSGARLLVASYLSRLNILKDHPESAAGAGFLNMDGAGSGKTRTTIAALREINDAVVKATGKSMRVLYFLPGGVSNAQAKLDLATEMKKLGFKGIPSWVTVAYHGEMPSYAHQSADIAVVDEAHDVVKNVTKSASSFESLKVKFRIMMTATPVDLPGQSVWFMQYMQTDVALNAKGAKAEAARQASVARNAPGVKPPYRPMVSKEVTDVKVSESIAAASRRGALTSREIPASAVTQTEFIPASEVDQAAQAAYASDGSVNAAWNLEHMKVPFMVRSAVREVAAGNQVVAVFAHATNRAGGKLSPVNRFAREVRIALRAANIAGLNGDPVTTIAGDSSPHAVAVFQDGTARVAAASDSKAGTGINLDDNPKEGQVSRPRVMLISRTSPMGGRLIQTVARIDRANTKTVPTVRFIAVENNKVDAEYRDLVKGKIKTQESATGATSPDAQVPLWKSTHFKHDTSTPSAADLPVRDAVRGDTHTPHDLLKLINLHGTSAQRLLAGFLLRLPVPPGLSVKMFSSDANWRKTYGVKPGDSPSGAFKPTSGATADIAMSDNPLGAAETYMHEYVHALTHSALNNSTTAVRIKSLMALVPLSTRVKFQNAFSNPNEFVAEAFSNPELQQGLRSIPAAKTTMWAKFLAVVQRVLRRGGAAPLSLLDSIVSASRIDKGTVDYSSAEASRYLPQELSRFKPMVDPAKKVPEMLARVLDKFPSKSHGVIGKALDKVLGAMAYNQIVDTFKKYANVATTERSHNLLEDMQALQEARAADSNHNDAAFKKTILDPMRAFANSAHGRERVKVRINGRVVDITRLQLLAELANASGYAKVHFGKLASDVSNRVLGKGPKTKSGKSPKPDATSVKYWAQFKPLFDANTNGLGVEGRKLYNDISSYFKEQSDLHARVIGATWLDAVHPLKNGSWQGQSADTLRAKLKSLEAAIPIGDTVARDQMVRIRDVLKTGRVPGAYFPLRRFGKYVVTIQHDATYRSAAERDALLSQYLGAKAHGTDLSGTVEFNSMSKFESESEAARYSDLMKGQYPDAAVSTPMLADSSGWTSKMSISPALIQSMQVQLDKQGVPKAERDAMVKQFTLAMLELSPDTSLASTLRPRKGTPGVSTDLERSLFSFGHAQSRYISSLKFSRRITDAQLALKAFIQQESRMAGTTNPERRNGAMRLHAVQKELALREQHNLDSQTSGVWAQRLSDVGFAYYLVGVSYNVINAMQVPLFTAPLLMSRHGGVRAARALASAYASVGRAPIAKLIKTGGTLDAVRGLIAGKDFNSADYSVIDDVLGSVADPRHKAMLKYLIDHGRIDVSLAMDMAQGGMRSHVNPDGSAKRQSRLGYLSEWMRMAPHITEVMNRSVTAVASYDLEYAKQIKDGKSTAAANNAAVEYAMRVVSDSQFLYAGWNKPRYLKGPWRSVAFMYKQYAQQTYFYIVSRAVTSSKGLTAMALGNKLTAVERADAVEATRALLWFGGMALAASGAVGATPEPVKWLLYLIQSITGAFTPGDEPYDFELSMKQAMGDWFGPTVGSVMSTGLPSLIGMDLSGRIGIDSMVAYKGVDTSSKDSFLASTMRLAGGPMLSLAERAMVTAPQQFARGDYVKGMEALVPKALRDPMKAIRFGTQGFTTYAGVKYAESNSLSAWDYGQLVLGFTPQKVSSMYAKRGVMRGDRVMRNKRKMFYDRVYIALQHGNDISGVIGDIRQWNAANPTYRITRANLIASVTRRHKMEADTQRGISVPKSSRAHVLGKIKNM